MRPEPTTYNRAATAVVQSRRLVEKARQELLLALDILRQLDGGGRGRGRPRVSRLLRAVEEELARLDGANGSESYQG